MRRDTDNAREDYASPGSLRSGEHSAHALVDQVDCFQWPDHDFEFDNLARCVPLDDVDSVDQDPVDLCLELQHCIGGPNVLSNVAEARIEEDPKASRVMG